jgi:hypothetical protein
MNALFTRLSIGIFCSGLAVACSSSSTPSTGGGSAGDAQTPPTTNKTDVEAWLKTGQYKQWHCEPSPRAGKPPTIHGNARICSNDAIANAASSTAPWPKGSAAVKELYNALTDATPAGYSVYVKTNADSGGGANWYYYEKVADGTYFADGFGSSGDAKQFCVSCHGLAGSDAAHTPTPNGHDYVYTPVK